MTDYKGHEVPEILPDEDLYYIICDEGIFTGWTEGAVLQRWRNRVDTDWRSKAEDLGYVDLGPDLFGCPRCGATAYDIYFHEKFHEDLTN